MDTPSPCGRKASRPGQGTDMCPMLGKGVQEEVIRQSDHLSSESFEGIANKNKDF